MRYMKKTGQSIVSRNIYVTPEFREKLDIDKLGHALIAVALSIAERKKAEEQALLDSGNSGKNTQDSPSNKICKMKKEVKDKLNKSILINRPNRAAMRTKN